MAADLAARHKVRAEEGPFPTQDCTTRGGLRGTPGEDGDTCRQWVVSGRGEEWGTEWGARPGPGLWGEGVTSLPGGHRATAGQVAQPGGLGAVGGVGPGWNWPGPPHTRPEVGGRGEPGPGAEAQPLWANPHPLRGLDAQPRPDLRSCKGGREGLRLPAQHPGAHLAWSRRSGDSAGDQRPAAHLCPARQAPTRDKAPATGRPRPKGALRPGRPQFPHPQGEASVASRRSEAVAREGPP